jgi:hypothetical protein
MVERIMGICWYCHWGWAQPVAEIYERALAALDGDESALEFGPSHIVWSDENFEDHSIDFCLKECDKIGEYAERFRDAEIAIVRRSLEELRAIPEAVRACQPADYDEENPDRFPPTGPMVRR